jgi:DHA1 family multidrug resistance protein-like MFS transporter
MSTFWGFLTARFSPKLLYMRGLLSHAILILMMGFVSNLPILLALRIFQGIFGGISTVGLIIVSSSSSRELASRDIGLFQNSMTFGQLLGPPIGALAASTLGYKGAFMSASALVFLTLVFCYVYVVEVPYAPRERGSSVKHTLNRRTLIGWGLCFTIAVQLMFLPSVLPNVFQGFNIERTIALKWAGLVVMLYTATAMVGTYSLCRLSAWIRRDRLIIAVGVFGTLLQSLLALSPGIVVFVAIRMLQTALIASILPLVFSMFSSDLDGRVIGFLNSGRFGGNALGPMIATSVFAFSSLGWLFLTVSGMSLFALLSFALFFGSTDNNGHQEI